VGISRNLKITNDGIAPNNKLNVTADEVILKDASGYPKLITSVTINVDITVAGPGGLDSGSEVSSAWYSIWLIHNGTTLQTLLSISSTAPAMPSGYTFKARIGWVRNDGSSNFLKFCQFGRRVGFPVPPTMAVGIAGNVNTPTWAAIGISSFVPPTAGIILVSLQRNGVSGPSMLAPNNGYGAINSNYSAQPPINDNDTNTSTSRQIYAEFTLESANIYWASSGSSNSVQCRGFEDA
jgi:hypothetical protein